MSKTFITLAGLRGRIIPLILPLLLILVWGVGAHTPSDDQYGSPTETASGNPAVNSAASEDPADIMIVQPATSQDAVSEDSDMLEVGFGLLAAIAGIFAAVYVVARVRPGLSLNLQRRAMIFLALVGSFFASAQLLYVLGELLSTDIEPEGDPGTYLELGYFAAGVVVAVCLVAAGYLLRRSELVEVGPLRRSADLDPLTALYNQPFFRRAASRRIAQAERHDIPLSLAMIDVDDFKSYNDRFGHESGNTVLRRVAGVLRRSVRADDLVARYGGEEFVMLLNSEPGESEDALERIRSQIEARCSPDGLVHRQVTVSIGITALADQSRTLEELIDSADEAMYRAKRSGKNRVISWETSA